MRLADLNPRFVRYEHSSEGDPDIKPAGKDWGDPYEHELIHEVDALAQAQGIEFLCPVCFAKNGGAVGTHSIEVTFRDSGALDAQGSHDSKGQPSRWEVSGTGFEDLTLRPSILLSHGCCWHGFVTNGEAA